MLLISAIILFEALSVRMVVNAFGHANELQFDTTQFETYAVGATGHRQLPFFKPVKLFGLFDIF